jgi:Protein of unknown function (DUF3237)
MQTLPAPLMEHVMDLVVQVAAPLEAGAVHGAATQGRRRIINIVGGSVRGSVNGRVLAGGADYQLITSDTSAVLDARYMLELDDPAHAGARVYVHNQALRRASAQDMERLAAGQPVDPSRIYFRCSPSFEVSHPALAWMTESLFLGVGARRPDCVEMSFYRVL